MIFSKAGLKLTMNVARQIDELVSKENRFGFDVGVIQPFLHRFVDCFVRLGSGPRLNNLLLDRTDLPR